MEVARLPISQIGFDANIFTVKPCANAVIIIAIIFVLLLLWQISDSWLLFHRLRSNRSIAAAASSS